MTLKNAIVQAKVGVQSVCECVCHVCVCVYVYVYVCVQCYDSVNKAQRD